MHKRSNMAAVRSISDFMAITDEAL